MSMLKSKPVFVFIFLLLILNNESNAKNTSFPTSQSIKEINDIDQLINELPKGKLSLILIYSPSCPHCVNFHPNYQALANKYYPKVHFYQINAKESNGFRKKFVIRGFPSLWFHFNDTYRELQANYTQKYISELIETKYMFACNELNYATAKEMLGSSNASVLLSFDNSLIGFFNSNDTLKTYLDLALENKKSLRNCYYAFNRTLNRSVVYSFNDQKGINAFNKFNYVNKTNDASSTKGANSSHQRLSQQFKLFVVQKATWLYLDFKGADDLNSLDSVDNRMMIFSYKTTKQRRNYIQLIKDISLQYNSILIPYSFVLFDINSNIRMMNRHPFATQVGVYSSEPKYRNIAQVTDINNLISSMMMNNGNGSTRANKTINDADRSLINKDILKTLVNNNHYEHQGFNWYSYHKEICCIFYLIIYSLIFYIVWNYLIKSYFDQDDSYEQIMSDLEEMKVINEIID